MAVVSLTSAGTVVDRIVGLEMGADDYIPKPFEPHRLLDGQDGQDPIRGC